MAKSVVLTGKNDDKGEAVAWREGDWICECGMHNFRNRVHCARCGQTDNGKGMRGVGLQARKGKIGSASQEPLVKIKKPKHLKRKLEQAKAEKDSEGAASLKEEIEVLKKEIAKVKQEYYENAGNFADDDKNKTSVDKDLLNNLSVFTSGMNLVFKWKNNTKYKINFYTSDKVLLHATSDYINARWQIKKPENGFYIVEFDPRGKRNTKFLLEFNKSIKIWLPK